MATPALLSGGRLEPRKVIGSVDTAEFAVSAAASLGFLLGIGSAGINWGYAIALLVGGLVAAPLAASAGEGCAGTPAGRGRRRLDPVDQYARALWRPLTCSDSARIPIYLAIVLAHRRGSFTSPPYARGDGQPAA